jgi:hypothetical protein
MTLVNRVIGALVALGLLGLAAALLLAPQPLRAAMQEQVATLQTLPPTALLVGGAILAAVGLLLLALELWPRRPRSFIAQVEGGTVEYPKATVAEIVERELYSIDGVRHARVETLGRGRRVAVQARLALAPDRDPQEVTARATSRMREKLGRGLGLALAQVHLAIEPTEPRRATEERPSAPVLPARA